MSKGTGIKPCSLTIWTISGRLTAVIMTSEPLGKLRDYQVKNEYVNLLKILKLTWKYKSKEARTQKLARMWSLFGSSAQNFSIWDDEQVQIVYLLSHVRRVDRSIRQKQWIALCFKNLHEVNVELDDLVRNEARRFEHLGRNVSQAEIIEVFFNRSARACRLLWDFGVDETIVI